MRGMNQAVCDATTVSEVLPVGGGPAGGAGGDYLADVGADGACAAEWAGFAGEVAGPDADLPALPDF